MQGEPRNPFDERGEPTAVNNTDTVTDTNVVSLSAYKARKARNTDRTMPQRRAA